MKNVRGLLSVHQFHVNMILCDCLPLPSDLSEGPNPFLAFAGWTVWVHYPTYSLEGFKSIGLPAFLSVDGHISAVSNTAYS